MWLAALIIGLPLVEISLFVTVGGRIGLWATLGIVLATAVFGMWVIRAQGGRAQHHLKDALNARRDPTKVVANDVLIVIAGTLLVMPGFFTDMCGLLLLVPAVRAALTRYAGRRANASGPSRPASAPWDDRGPTAPRRPGATDIIDATWEELPPAAPRDQTRH